MIAPRRLHRVAGAVLAVHLVVHVANHLAALAGVDAHVRFMDAARRVYRQPVVEVVLLLCVALQAASGLRMLWVGRQRRRGVLAGLIVARLMGKVVPVEVPGEYLLTFGVK